MSDHSGLNFTSLLTVIFIVLKLDGIIDWSWWWVVSPTLIAIIIDAIVCVGMILYLNQDTDKCKDISKKNGGGHDA